MRRSTVTVIAALCLLVVTMSTAARSYALYYNATPGNGSAIVVTNVIDAETTAELTAYDSAGNEFASVEVVLEGLTSAVIPIDEALGEIGGGSWGLVRVETEGRLALALWLGNRTEWNAIVNASIPLLQYDAVDISGFWLTLNYANTESRSTGIAVVNPNDETATGQIFFYGSHGTRLMGRTVELAPRAAAFLVLRDELEVGEDSWGMVDLHTDIPVLLVAEYMDGIGNRIDVDVSSSAYLVDR